MFWPPNPKLFDRVTSTFLSSGLVGDVVEVAVVARPVEVDRRWEHAVSDREQAHDRLDAPGRRDQVAHHALGAGDWHVVRRVAEAPADGQGLDRVVDRRAGAVRVDVVDLRRVTLGIGKGFPDAGDRPPPSS